MGRKDIMPEQQRFIDGYLKCLTYDLYDKLIIVRDAPIYTLLPGLEQCIYRK